MLDTAEGRRDETRWRLAYLVPVVLLGACTWLDDPFEPSPLPSVAAAETGADASISLPAGPDASAELMGCAQSELGGTMGPGCPPTLELLDPALSRPDSTRAEGVADAGLDPSPRACPLSFDGFGAPERISGLDAIGELFGPALSADGLSLYFSASLPGDEQIYTATRAAPGSAAFSNAVPVDTLNSAALDGSPFVSANGRRIYFFSNRGGGAGSRDIWLSERADATAELAPPVLLAGVNTPSLELLPWLSADELLVLFVSSRPFGRDSDIWQATRASIDSAFGSLINVAALSSADTEGRAVLSSDGLRAIFSSDRPGGVGNGDLWTASRPDLGSPFSEPRNLPRLNTGANEQDVALSGDERELFFASSRGGVSSLWRSVLDCP